MNVITCIPGSHMQLRGRGDLTLIRGCDSTCFCPMVPFLLLALSIWYGSGLGLCSFAMLLHGRCIRTFSIAQFTFSITLCCQSNVFLNEYHNIATQYTSLAHSCFRVPSKLCVGTFAVHPLFTSSASPWLYLHALIHVNIYAHSLIQFLFLFPQVPTESRACLYHDIHHHGLQSSFHICPLTSQKASQGRDLCFIFISSAPSLGVLQSI